MERRGFKFIGRSRKREHRRNKREPNLFHVKAAPGSGYF